MWSNCFRVPSICLTACVCLPSCKHPNSIPAVIKSLLFRHQHSYDACHGMVTPPRHEHAASDLLGLSCDATLIVITTLLMSVPTWCSCQVIWASSGIRHLDSPLDLLGGTLHWSYSGYLVVRACLQTICRASKLLPFLPLAFCWSFTLGAHYLVRGTPGSVAIRTPDMLSAHSRRKIREIRRGTSARL